MAEPPLVQLPFDHRKVLVAKSLALVAGDTLLGENGSEAAAQVAALVYDHAVATANIPHSGDLGTALAAWEADVRAHSALCAALPEAPAAAIHAFAAQIGRLRAALHCPVCPLGSPPAAGHSALCDAHWPPTDAEGGACLGELTSLFRFAEGLTSAWYADAGFPLTSGLVNVRLATWLPSQQFPPPEPTLPITGRWRPPPTGNVPGGPPTSVVDLFLDVKALDVRTMQAVLYVLLHELVVHAYQRVGGPDGAQRVSQAGDDGFAEGWMDFIARLLFQQALDPGAVYGDAFSSPSGVRALWLADPEPGLEVYKARGRPAYVRQGRRAAAQVWSALSFLTPGSPATAPFLALSCGMNVHPLSDADRRAVVSRAATGLPGPGERPAPWHAPAMDALRRYVTHVDAGLFVRDLIGP